ncbi:MULTISPECIES: ATP-binding protein [Pseudomonas]|uniref:AAA family ATPase n=1 Tax=Pseudomonas taiwanensis TaxID=470150 RepID=A0ABR6V518_9PSED|nr:MULTISPECIES: AAA family ATPase [Pseudomonas]AGZ35506.1 magnesium chelatase [Pseudomonas sp. VLB120]MBC3475601.1 AAA family ATPase [Pseudomonas taiwanensis]MBC3489525.1 AAA family ATPase [Pseudomonas taiwanensis]MDT8923636.1 AAA family ATPase [Pseudomonas taiwanensis]QQZ34196.1 AAA family ATPase [Pseudomonas sp. SK2]
MSEPVQFPLAAVVGADDLKLALCLTAIDPRIGGVLIEGPRGMAKSTLARGLADLLGEGPFVTLPLGASEERLVGTLDLDAALGQGKAQFSPGVLAQADGGVLYVDEVNLLPDTLVDLLLDVAASGTNRVERDGISHRHSARFVLIGTMNPEEGELRPQLLDRFGLNVALEGVPTPDARQHIIRRRLAFDSDPQAFCAQWAAAQAQLRERCQAARQRLERIALDDQALAWITERCFAAGVDGLRADLVWLRAARAHCAWRGAEVIAEEDVDAVAEFALRHRRRVSPPAMPPSAAPEGGQGEGQRQGGQGDWGAMAPQPVATGARREVPNWAKKP